MINSEDSSPIDPVFTQVEEDELDFGEMTPHELFLASLPALMKLWDTPEEDATWAHL